MVAKRGKEEIYGFSRGAFRVTWDLGKDTGGCPVTDTNLVIRGKVKPLRTGGGWMGSRGRKGSKPRLMVQFGPISEAWSRPDGVIPVMLAGSMGIGDFRLKSPIPGQTSPPASRSKKLSFVLVGQFPQLAKNTGTSSQGEKAAIDNMGQASRFTPAGRWLRGAWRSPSSQRALPRNQPAPHGIRTFVGLGYGIAGKEEAGDRAAAGVLNPTGAEASPSRPALAFGSVFRGHFATSTLSCRTPGSPLLRSRRPA